MKTFDEVIPEITTILQSQGDTLKQIEKLIINRDLNGRIRLVVDEKIKKVPTLEKIVETIAQNMADALGPRVPDKEKILYESKIDTIINGVPCFSLEGFPNVIVADRLLTESDWTNIVPIKSDSHRIVFYSIKGGVGRSTALAVTAWALAEEGKKVMVLDMDLESPGLSSSLLSREKSTAYGIADWLIEDLVDNDEEVFPYMTALSDLSRNGEIYVVPAYGKYPGEYISKMGRAWMPKYLENNNSRELWQSRLNRLLNKLEKKYKPDVVLIDSRAGIDEISSACITGLGAECILLFSIDSDQTWDGYNILFHHWLRHDTVLKIRERLQIVGAMIPENVPDEYKDSLCEHAWNLFIDQIYDVIPADNVAAEVFSFNKDDTDAPHYPWPVHWNRGFASLPNLHQPLQQQAVRAQIMGIFGDFIDCIKEIINNG
ncbi:hypothetical protein AGMMS50230_20660 [Spirochaetia bacterium]|nr:hypothetical protein AGMMS50230_20660 [Spirochaetia bacterium]